MPNMDNLLLKRDDGTDVTYYPISDRPILQWRTNVSGVSVEGQARVEIQTEDMKSGKTRANMKIVQPIMAVIPSGSVNAAGIQAAPTVVDEDAISITFYAGKQGSNETRADLVRQAAHLLSGAGSTTTQNIAVSAVTADLVRDSANTRVVPYGLVNLLWPS